MEKISKDKYDIEESYDRSLLYRVLIVAICLIMIASVIELFFGVRLVGMYILSGLLFLYTCLTICICEFRDTLNSSNTTLR